MRDLFGSLIRVTEIHSRGTNSKHMGSFLPSNVGQTKGNLYPFQFALWKKLIQKPAVAHEHLGFELSNCRTSWQRIMR